MPGLWIKFMIIAWPGQDYFLNSSEQFVSQRLRLNTTTSEIRMIKQGEIGEKRLFRFFFFLSSVYLCVSTSVRDGFKSAFFFFSEKGVLLVH